MTGKHTMRSAIRFAAALLVISAGVFVLPLMNAQSAPSESTALAQSDPAVHGQELFNTYGCWECHGYEGQGGVGPKLAPRPLAYQFFQEAVRTPLRDMPRYSTAILSNDDLADVYAFIQSIPAGPAAQDIPLLSQSE